jgi:drug/metabolite transporter (DMT)-like permease
LTPANRPAQSLNGVLALLGGTGVFTLQDVIIKLMSGAYPLTEVLVLRCLVAFVPLGVFLAWDGGFASLRTRGLDRRRLAFLVGRGLLLLIAYSNYYLALAALPLAETVALFFTGPLFIVLLSRPVLGERPGKQRILAVLAGFGGVVFICRPGSGLFDPAALLSISSAAAYGLAMLLARKVSGHEQASVMALFQNLVYFAAALLVALITNWHPLTMDADGHASLRFLLSPWVVPTPTDLLLMGATGIIGGIGSFLLTQAYRLAEANIVAPFEYAAIALATFWGWLFWNEIPSLASFLGIAFIIGAGLYVLKTQSQGPAPGRAATSG